MKKKWFRIGELAHNIGVEKFVIRFWEKEFNVKTYRSEGGQRFYKKGDLELFKKIKDLLYNRGFTIAGAKKQLFGRPQEEENITFTSATHAPEHGTELSEQITMLHKQLLRLRRLL